MLVLSRKSGEKIHVGEDVVIEIKRVTGSRVTVAIEAPREIRILRGELKEAATEFEEPTGAGSGHAAPVAPSNAAAPTAAPVETSGQVEPYLVSHQRMNPPDIGPTVVS